MLLVVHPEPVPLATDSEGIIRVGGSRVTLDAVISAFHAGATAEEIAQQYPALALADVYSVLTYYLRHQKEVDDCLCGRRLQADRVRARNEARFDPSGIRDRLLAR
ncbi:MAG: DUF433 domain-containing protein [Egibacteraceae bacterium]